MFFGNGIKTMKIENININNIFPYENNPRVNDGAVQYVKESIRNFGFKVPMVIDKNNVIVCGHTRYKASQELGLTELPCIRADDLTEDQIKAFRLADNKVSEIATWDMDKLNIELDEISLDMTDFGFDSVEIEEVTLDEVVEDKAPEPPKEPKSKVGDIYQLGNHRLICGDSTDVNVIDRLMDGVKAQLLLTDPPYGIDVVQNKQVGGGKNRQM